jgi:hypothetical protein
MRYNAKILQIENGWLLDDNVEGITYYGQLELVLAAVNRRVTQT